jgi:phosphoribosylamine-glycine ligase
MAATLYGTLTAPKWGTTDEDALGIIVSNLQRADDTEETTFADGDGDIQHVAYHGQNAEITCDFRVAATGYPADDLVGGTVTLTDAELGGTFIVKGVTNTKAEGAWMSGSMTLREFPEITAS